MYRKDYARAGYVMLPVVEPDGNSTARQTLLFTLLLALASLLPTVVGVTGAVYLAGALVLGLITLGVSVTAATRMTRRRARRVFLWSLLYQPSLMALLLIDTLP